MHFQLNTLVVVAAIVLPVLSTSLTSEIPHVSEKGTESAAISGLLTPNSAKMAASAATCHRCGNTNRCCNTGYYCVTDGYSVGCCKNGKKCYKPAKGCTFPGDHKCSGHSWCCPPGVSCTSKGCKF